MESSPPASVQPLARPGGAPPGRAPWDAADLFPARPEGGGYGWRSRARSQPCTREELIERCRGGGPPVDLVWTPETTRMVPPAEVPWLLEPLRRRARADLRYNLRIDAGVLLIGTAYLWQWGGRAHPFYIAMFVLFAIVPTAQDLWALARLRRSFAYLGDQAAALRYGVWLGTRRIVATYFVAAALVAVWAAQVVVGMHQSLLRIDPRPSISAAGLVKHLAREGQWWRLLTAELLHGHWLHLVMNLLSLLAVGRLVEVHASPAHLPIVFLFSAVSASGASLWWDPARDSVGASGAIMGMVGFLAVLGYRRRDVLPRGFLKWVSVSIALTFGAGLVAHEVIDNAAHLGGLLGGAVLGFVYVRRRGDRDRLAPSLPSRAAGGLAAVALAAVTFWTIWLVIRDRLAGVLGWA